ncbi:leucine-rich repeat receptor protein kinase EMS1-like protein [Cinnamomum micranthum f. kanehirae]|uniref:Leucine-rich repeat receptor protein kinase EMS1-like protein n=1 Tax=Cinnamomum micranthum f. kanehirae TaxID=337451 RepID=A0A3S4ND41_9MAGN|nr:leucine-rich repeat receptor protein kinase EMS1-like protein [Cinnamomum micranthum f. kanehirae]
MEWPPAFYFWVVLFTFQIWVYGCFGCFYEEEIALLELKSSINHPNGTSLLSWRVGTNCCTWKGVTCSSTVGRVIALDLSSTIDYRGDEYCYLNASLLLPFEELQSLDLSRNDLWGFIDEEALNRWSRLGKLEELYLSYNSLNKTILPFLGALKSLKKLDLSVNAFGGPLPVKAIETFTSLRTIDFSWNKFNDSQSIQGFCKLKDLQRLDLGYNHFKGPIPLCLSNLRSLQLLNLTNNGFTGMIPTSTTGNDESQGPLPIKGLCKFKDIKWLDLSSNDFEGSIPSCLSNFSNLQLLDLSSNRFSGKIPASTFAHLFKLKEFVVSNNDLEVEIEYPPLNSTFQFTMLGLSYCKLSKYTGGGIPNFLYNQRQLMFADLSHNHLLGKFPIWLLENNPRLQFLNLMNNSFWGTFPLPLHFNHTSMISLDASNNHIDGLLPSNIGYFLPNLELLNMSRNSFQGSIPPSMGNMRHLKILDLSHNTLSGEIPEHLAAGCVSLSTLRLSNNNLKGKIFSTDSNMSQLNSLHLDNNHFVGTISPSLFNISRPTSLDIGDNHLSGRIPSQIGDILELSTLILRGNHFNGLVPLEFCKLQYLQLLDLSDNNLYGPLPSCSNFTNLKYMHLENNEFSGFIPSALSSSSSMISLNIKHNHIADVIPVWMGSLSTLRILLLKGNDLHGHIPNELCQLKHLSLLDLSYNKLFGSLPSCINDLTFGRSIILDEFRVGGFYTFSSPKPNENAKFSTEEMDEPKEVGFITKRMENFYKGGILNYMSGIDLSCNQLTGEIPREMGQLSGLHSMNLSYNQFVGPIPTTFKNLSNIESLDLSYNKLNGTIPPELTELNYLEVFSVAHNNLSGRTPDMKYQFNTFTESSYEGNPLLCGAPLNKSCISTTHTIQSPEQEEEDDNDDGLVSFFASFVGSYFVFLFGTILVLYFISQRRAVCFFHVVDSWCAFLLYKLFKL